MRPGLYKLLLFVIASVVASKVDAQTCTGSLGAPVVNETFGKGDTYAPGPPLPDGITSLQYVYGGSCGGEDNQYSIMTEMGSSCKGGTWQALAHDHTYEITGEQNGYMMIINASIDPSQFVTYKIDGSKLCPNTTYQFSAWIMNILRPLPQTVGFSRPNITFTIEKTDGTPPKIYNTGDILESDNPTWIEYGTFFTSPSDGSDVIVKMFNNGRGGNGNDLALDDITVSPCGPVIQTGFGTIGNTQPQSKCANDDLNYTIVSQQTGYTDPDIKWQINTINGTDWHDIPGEHSPTLQVTIPKAAAGKYQYRIGFLNKSSIGAEQCRIYSDPLTINVYPPPDTKIDNATSACEGQPLQLRASGATTYEWSGPKGFSSAENSPVVTYTADKSYEGVYTLKSTKDGCPLFSNTTVTVYEAPKVLSVSASVPICEGDATQLSVGGSNITHYKWEPSTGLDHDDIANPMASPMQTTTYTVTVSNDGCADFKPTGQTTITVNKLPMADAGKAQRMFDGQTVKLPGTAGGDNVSYHWTPIDYLDDPTSLTPVSSSPNDITYTLHVVSGVNCGEATSTVFVRVYKLLTVVNSFSPNGDGVNDYWYIKNIENYPKADISVFNRYGQRVYESIGYAKQWDGTFNGSKLPTGTYYYMIDFRDDYVPKQAGWVFIVR